jgi:hypothetical protein
LGSEEGAPEEDFHNARPQLNPLRRGGDGDEGDQGLPDGLADIDLLEAGVFRHASEFNHVFHRCLKSE